jgi:prevent-host-death family protein
MTQLHRNFSRLVAQAAAGETILVTRNGKNLCRLRPLDEADLQEGSGAPEIDAAATAKA